MEAIKQRPTKKQLRHKPKPIYPDVARGMQAIVERPECGTHLRGGFVFQRPEPKPVRSKYTPDATTNA